MPRCIKTGSTSSRCGHPDVPDCSPYHVLLGGAGIYLCHRSVTVICHTSVIMRHVAHALLTAVCLVGIATVPTTADMSAVLWQKAAANSLFTDPCEHKDRCLVIMIAPWCPYCNNAIPLFIALRRTADASGRFGVKILIAGDRQDSLEDEARKIGDNTYIDPNNTFAHETGLEGYPTLATLDSDNRIIAQTTGANPDASDAAQRALLARLSITL